MQKVVAGSVDRLSDFAEYLNQQLKQNPGWRIEKIFQIHRNYGTGVVVVFDGPKGTDGPGSHNKNESSD